MSIALDHVFVMCAPGAPEADALVRAGLREGSPNTHPGQGTACRRFFFRNAYLELLWVDDAEAAQSEKTAPTRLWERWGGRHEETCPFGIVLRPDGGGKPPFETWGYHPAYLPPHLSIDLARGVPLTEPELIYMPFADRRDSMPEQPRDHGLPCDLVHTVDVGLRAAGPRSAAARAVEAAGIVTFRASDEWRLELVFDPAGRRLLDFGPALPITLRCEA